MHFQYARKLGRLIDDVAKEYGVENKRVTRAMSDIPRHLFVDEALWHRAYTDDALPIGYGQTISKVSTVMMMTAALDPQPSDRVLEVGTGSGYQASVLAKLVGELYSIERIAGLAVKSQGVLNLLRAFNVSVKNGDGTAGWPEMAPFDKIVVTAAPDKLPRPLLEQMKIGGRLVSPVDESGAQMLRLLIREDENTWSEYDLNSCKFVPLISGR